MIGSVLDAVDYATKTNAELVRSGVRGELVTWERMRRTGHVRRISAAWAPSIGRWGGVRSLRDIASALEVPLERAHSWARFRGLRTRTRKFHRTQPQLALAALATTGASRDVARELGILPIECALYRSAAELMRVELRVSLREMLRWAPDELEAEWEALELVVECVPPRTTVDYSDRAEIAAVVDEARRAMRGPSELERTLATLRKELPEGPDEEHRADRRTLSRALTADLDAIVAEAEKQERL